MKKVMSLISIFSFSVIVHGAERKHVTFQFDDNQIYIQHKKVQRKRLKLTEKNLIELQLHLMFEQFHDDKQKQVTILTRQSLVKNNAVARFQKAFIKFLYLENANIVTKLLAKNDLDPNLRSSFEQQFNAYVITHKYQDCGELPLLEEKAVKQKVAQAYLDAYTYAIQFQNQLKNKFEYFVI